MLSIKKDGLQLSLVFPLLLYTTQEMRMNFPPLFYLAYFVSVPIYVMNCRFVKSGRESNRVDQSRPFFVQ